MTTSPNKRLVDASLSSEYLRLYHITDSITDKKQLNLLVLKCMRHPGPPAERTLWPGSTSPFTRLHLSPEGGRTPSTPSSVLGDVITKRKESDRKSPYRRTACSPTSALPNSRQSRSIRRAPPSDWLSELSSCLALRMGQLDYSQSRGLRLKSGGAAVFLGRKQRLLTPFMNKVGWLMDRKIQKRTKLLMEGESGRRLADHPVV
ncbi:hypothetical protein H920_10727 [Fukomys damarensis]|uniref:Uncharacterized protein n=1 Tax=Fukomys damarensis TaxID=885580 RepID=A0A091DYF4_FUKDA|nr:hypothetical protein H920_10727 [Fukomys damarensis]